MHADDHGQEVVEVVRDAAGELADGFHLLRLPDLRLVGFDLLKAPDHGLGLAALLRLFRERRIGLLKLNACRHGQEPGQQQQQPRHDDHRDRYQDALDAASSP